MECPVCGAVYDPDRQPRIRRGGTVARDEVVASPKVVDKSMAVEVAEEDVDDKALLEADTDESESGDDVDETKIDDLNSEDRDLIEDTSDLGEDDDDIGEVMEHLDDDVEDKS